ncbi:MAG: carboxypeptidase regulatory-like domain-containing protein, partial [Myxococcales bacterium]
MALALKQYRPLESRSMRIGILPIGLWISLGIAASTSPARAATLEGVVTTSAGQPVHGAMVTVFSANRMRKATVFTGAEGGYLIVVDYEG